MSVELPDEYCLLTAMKSLTIDQLIGIIGKVVINHPDIEKVGFFDIY